MHMQLSCILTTNIHIVTHAPFLSNCVYIVVAISTVPTGFTCHGIPTSGTCARTHYGTCCSDHMLYTPATAGTTAGAAAVPTSSTAPAPAAAHAAVDV